MVGEGTLHDLIAEYKSSGPTYQRTVHYRRGLIRLLQVLEFRSNNTALRPALDALDVVVRYAPSSSLTFEAERDDRVVRGLGGWLRGDRADAVVGG